MKGSVAYQHATDKDTGEVVADAPQWQTYLDGQWFWIGDRKRIRGDLHKEFDDSPLFTLTLRRKKMAKHGDLALPVRNLLAKNFQESSNGLIAGAYPREGRRIISEVRFHVQ